MAQTPATRRSEGETIDYTPGSAVSAGDVVVQGRVVGIAPQAIAASVKGTLDVTGIWNVPKDVTNFSSVGLPVYWNATGDPYGGTAGSGCATRNARGNTFMGFCVETAGTTTGDCDVLLHSPNKPFDTTVSATVAATGSAQGNAAQVDLGFTLVTGADATKGVLLPVAEAGRICIIKNVDAANAVLKVYPASGDAINALSANASLDMAAKTSALLVAYDSTTWYSVPLLPS